MPRRVLVVTTSLVPQADVESIVREHAGSDAEVHVVAPASKISWLDRLTNAEDDARADAAERAETATVALPGDQGDAHVGDIDPLQAIADALRMFPADELVLLTPPDADATWIEAGLANKANERFAIAFTHLVTGPMQVELLEQHVYTVSYRLQDGKRVERSYHHHAKATFEEGLVLTPDHGWLYDPITITKVEMHPNDTRLGSAQAELYEPHADRDDGTQHGTAVESL
jgi:hypothetical protein